MYRFEEVSISVSARRTKNPDVSEGEVEEGLPEEEEVLDPVVATENFGKLWKKFKIWFTDNNRNSVEKIHTYFGFIQEEGDAESIKKACDSVKLDFPTKKEILLLNATCIKILDVYAKEFTRIQKTGCFLKAFNQPSSKGLNIPECLQFIELWKAIGVKLSFDYESRYLIQFDFREYNKKFIDVNERLLSKLGISTLADLEELTKMVDRTDQYIKTWYSTTNKQMANLNKFPMGPEGLTLSKTEFETARTNYLRAVAIRNGAVDTFDILDEILYFVRNILDKVKSKI